MGRFTNWQSGGVFTKHAIARCRQRGIKSEVVEFVLKNFDCDHHAGAGVTAIRVSRHRLELLRAEGHPDAILSMAERTVLLLADSGAVITAVNRPSWCARYRRGSRRTGRKHSNRSLQHR